MLVSGIVVSWYGNLQIGGELLPIGRGLADLILHFVHVGNFLLVLDNFRL